MRSLSNYLLYDGKPVLLPENLRSIDTTELAIPHNDYALFHDSILKKHYSPGSDTAVQKYRDILKEAAIKSDDHYTYLLLGIENQSDIHYAMPAKNLLYDALQYTAQIDETASLHKREKQSVRISSGEFLSGFYKTDKLKPVITLTVYFGPDKWDGPRSLQEMFQLDDPDLLKFLPDYPLHLIEPASMSEDDLNKLTTSLKEVLGFIKYSKDQEGLQKFISSDTNFTHLDRNAARVINTCTNLNLNLNIDSEKEEFNMCQAFNEMLANSRLEGERIGKLEGKRIGKLEGERIGKLEGERTGSSKSLLLAELLIRDNRLNDISLARKDPKHFEMLCKEYEIEFEH